MTQKINLNSITQDQFINIMQEIGMHNDTFKYARYKSIRTQQYKTIKLLPPDLSDQINLFKGLVLCERDFNWIGGSVASNIMVYREISSHPFMHKHKDKLDELINWTLQNRGRNPYTPFGTWRYSGCKSIDDMEAWDLEQERRYRLQAKKEELIKKDKAKKKRVMKKISELRPVRRYVQDQMHKLNIELFLMEDSDAQFNMLMKNKINFPVNLVPNECWQSVTNRDLSIDQIKTLLSIIPRRSSHYLKDVVKPKLLKMKRLSLVN